MTLKRQGRTPSTAEFTIKLDGDGIINGTASARAVASTLVAAADLVQALAASGDFRGHVAPELKVEAHKDGSFEILLLLEAMGEWWATVRPALVGDDAAAVTNILAYVGAIGALVEYLRKVGKKKVKGIEPRDDGDVDVALEGGDVVRTTHDVIAAAAKPKVQRSAKKLVSSATFSGIDSVTISVGTINVTVNSAEAESFPEPTDAEPELLPKTYEAFATFRVADFSGDVWTAETTSGPVRATITDKDFLGRVNAGANLNKYAEYRITILEVPRVTEGGRVVTDKSITTVREINEHPKRALPDETEEGEI